ncbi:hypothetical protein PPTG_00889 [Phytophthora nicotianae INRA-310]|uniref:Uncharacterized protein n=1 Tax=Phytophthora nicotianae (strain INRA-310) TaxID=761204 RepID=W2RJ76_PHYN3|nr:hypothetical protein PPTG_00889 [Phytophthora nicotianae INRA-310]ETN24665.1 hypothetical protein PPTG_00889 [Phytophthora nicotianae INRA-310]
MVANREGRWNEDGVDGGPSSMELLLVWLRRDNNAVWWREASEKRLQSTMAHEVHEFFVDHGVTHRSLVSKGFWRENDNEEAKQTVLRICPDYEVVAPLLHCNKPRITTSPHVYGLEASIAKSLRRSARNQNIRPVDAAA